MPEETTDGDTTTAAPESNTTAAPPENTTAAPATGPKIGDTRPAPEATAPAAPGSTASTGPTKLPPPTEYEIRLRDEVAETRRKYGPIAEPLLALPDEQREGVLELVRVLAEEDPTRARALVAELVGLEVPAEQDPRQAPLTRAEFEEWQQAQQDHATGEQSLNAFREECQGLGFEPGTAPYFSLLGVLEANPQFTTKEAADHMLGGLSEHDKTVIAAYLKSKNLPIPSPTTGAGGGSDEKPITDFKQARAATLASLG